MMIDILGFATAAILIGLIGARAHSRRAREIDEDEQVIELKKMSILMRGQTKSSDD